MAMAMTVLGHRIEIDPGEKQCFFEALQPQDKVSASAIAGWELEGQRKRKWGTRVEEWDIKEVEAWWPKDAAAAY